MWKNTDPRYDIGKRARIIILRPDKIGNGHFESSIADVDTKEGWNIFTDFEDCKLIDVDTNWDSAWWWTFAPRAVEPVTYKMNESKFLERWKKECEEWQSIANELLQKYSSVTAYDVTMVQRMRMDERKEMPIDFDNLEIIPDSD